MDGSPISSERLSWALGVVPMTRQDIGVTTGGLRRFRVVGAVLVAALTVGVAGCSSSGPSAAAKALCGSVFAQPIPTNESVAVSTQTIKDGEHSGDPELDADAVALIKSLKDPNKTAVDAASSRIAKQCERLGIPTADGNP
jgi:hypothetical protein